MANRQKPRKKRPTDDDPDDDMPGGPDPTITLIGTRFETEEETAKMTRRQREEVNKDKYVPIYKQELKDERGRKVLPQGAFKGGRVAGFNNTVGSAEGWAPAQFVSSRSNRATETGKSTQQATDFMDEEDFEEMGLGAKDVSAASDFDTFGSSRPGNTGGLEHLITPAKDSAGVRLLRLMGWREGHGIGPRKKKAPKTKKKYGVALPPGVEGEEDSDDEAVSSLAAEVGVAPKNTEVMEFKPKDDHFGLGYDPYSQAPEFRAMREGRSGNVPGKPKEKQRLRMGLEYSGGDDFGMSVLEGGGSTFGVYDSDNRSEYSRVIEDAEPSRYDKLDYDAKKGKLTNLVATEFGEDGRPIIPGFVKAHRVLQQQKFFAAPDVPRDFDPRHRVTPVNAESKLSSAAQLPQYQITPDQRGELLGEQQLKRSVFDLLSKEDRERLHKLGGSVPPGATPTNALAAPNAASEALAKLGIKTDRFASSGTHNLDEEEKKIDPNKPLAEAFGPFRFDKEKQKRYDLWLRVQRGEELKPDDWKDGLTDDQRVREHDEFARVWGKFKPLSEAMAKRFKSANVMLGNEEYNEKELTEYQTDTSVQADAAKMKMFGKLTRSTEEWRPSGLLCKRFNIMNPYKGAQDWDKKKDERKAAIDIFMEMELPQFMPELAKAKETDAVKTANDENNKDDNNNDNDDKKDDDKDDEEEEIQEEEKPSIDLFKAIFEASDEEEDEEENNEENNENNNETETNKTDQEQVVEEPKIESEKMTVEEEKVPEVPEKTEEEIRAQLKEDLIKEREARMKSKLTLSTLDQDEEEEGLNFKSLTAHKKKNPIVPQEPIRSSETSDGIAQVKIPVEEKVPDVTRSDPVQKISEEPEEVIGPELPPMPLPGTNTGLSFIMPMNIESSESSDSSSSEESSKRKHKDKKEKRDKKEKHKKSKKRKHKDKKDKKDKKEKHKRKKQRTS